MPETNPPAAENVFSAQPYQGITTFGRARHTRDPAGAEVAVVGIPYDGATSYRSGARFGPRAIREQSLLLWGYNNALGVAPLRALNVIDYGDVEVVPVDVEATQRAVAREVAGLLSAGLAVFALGGDHSVTLGLLRAHAARFGPLAVVQFDAHPDTWDAEFGERRYSHGTVFRRAIEEGLVDTSAYLQLGIRGPTGSAGDYADARRLGAHMLTRDEIAVRGIDSIVREVRERIGSRPLYATLDIDAVDPAFAPGTGTPEPGGLTSHDMLQLVRGLAGLRLVGGDVVEVAPPYDPAQITAILAANLAFELLSLAVLARRAA